jgi:hypothetical protein
MEFTEIKKIRVQHDENFSMLPISIQDPNYTQYTAYLTKADCDLIELVNKTIQDYIPYKLEKTNDTLLKLTIENHVINIEFLFNIVKFSIDDFVYYIEFKKTLSTYKVLSGIFDLIFSKIKDLKIEEYNNRVLLKIRNSNDFEYRWANDKLKEEVILTYKPFNINILCEIKDETISFISYLHHEGETYYNGEEKMSVNYIESNIRYYQKLLNEIIIIKNKLALL